MSNKKYRLLKDAPEVKEGEIYEPQPGNKNWYVSKSNSLYHAATIENNPEWFEEIKEERVEVDDIYILDRAGSFVSSPTNRWQYIFYMKGDYKISKKQLPAIKQVIENVLNNTEKYHWYEKDHFFKKEQVDKLMEDAFNESRLNHCMFGFKHDDFESYKKSLTNKIQKS